MQQLQQCALVDRELFQWLAARRQASTAIRRRAIGGLHRLWSTGGRLDCELGIRRQESRSGVPRSRTRGRVFGLLGRLDLRIIPAIPHEKEDGGHQHRRDE
jgi:hypothetical protein